MSNSTVQSLSYEVLLDNLLDEVCANYQRGLKPMLRDTSHLQKIAAESLNPVRGREQLAVLERCTGLSLQGKRILEIGAGHGLTVVCARLEWGAEAYGIEPSEAEYSGSLEVSRKVLNLTGLPADTIKPGVGEAIPFPDDYFDCVFSSNVLEHVQDPQRVIAESLRVTKPGGFVHIVVPSYGSWWEGHYGVLWFPHMSASLGKFYVRLLGRDPSFIDTLQLINHGWLARMLKPYQDSITILGWGQDIWEERVTTGNFSAWSSLQAVQHTVTFLRRAGLARLVVWIGKKLNWETPIVLTICKLPKQDAASAQG